MKRIFALLSAVAMALTLVACGEASGSTSSSGQSSGDTITIKLPHCYVEGHPLTDTLQNFFKPELESRSNGRLTVDIYPNSTLATEEQIYEGLRNNTYEMVPFFRTEFLLSQRSSSRFYLRTMIRPVLLCMKGIMDIN